MTEPLTLRPKLVSVRGGLAPLMLCVGLACGAAMFYREGMQLVAGIVGLLGFGFTLLTVTHLSSRVQVDKDGVRLRTVFSSRLLSWRTLRSADISTVRASSPFVPGDIEKTLILDGPEGTISVNLTMWNDFATLERIVRERAFGGEYKLHGSAASGGG